MAALQCNIKLSYPSNSLHSALPSVKLPKSASIIRMAAFQTPFPQVRSKRDKKKVKIKENSLPILKKIHVKVGDTVKVIAGHEKGKVSEVLDINKKDGTIIVKDVNLKTKHVSGREGEAGQIVQVEGPIHSSNVMLYSKTQNVASRVGHKVLEDGTKVRYLVKTGEVIDDPKNWQRVSKNQQQKKDT
eukprot:TRINITY_DN554_c0_g1_i1.p1 TRINITY_DN554_c0_g1~~TRINITY_DN554_c0_g1_i1.p1  ORF type:complete len:187 (-),score=40.01 TRINITY_DN554_c0_g1_i1:172-732(-)